MSRIDIAADTAEFVRLRVAARDNGSVVDPTDYPVDMAVLTTEDATPEEEDWSEAEWEAETNHYYARLLVGVGTDHPLVAGRVYKVWVRIHADPETPVAGLGWLTAY